MIGFRRWRSYNLGPILAADGGALHFVRDCAAAERLAPGPGDRLIVWGMADPAGIDALVGTSRAARVRIEDGFFRSVGLGSDLVPPRSLVFDRRGIYFDATRPSDLEHILATTRFDPDVLARAGALRAMIAARGLTKYNIEPLTPPDWTGNTGKQPVVLVPGQVETDASIAFGAGAVRTNLALLAAARVERPDAFLVYKPHPDVVSGNRRGLVADRAAIAIADHIETRASIVACIDAADEVHTITSLAGFDALIRRKPVVTHGAPFYAGWGLTRDCARLPAFARRRRRLSLDELVAGALLLYPRYWDPIASAFTEAESALAAIAAERDRLAARDLLARLSHGFFRRQGRKLTTIAHALLGPGVPRA